MRRGQEVAPDPERGERGRAGFAEAEVEAGEPGSDVGAEGPASPGELVASFHSPFGLPAVGCLHFVSALRWSGPRDSRVRERCLPARAKTLRRKADDGLTGGERGREVEAGTEVGEEVSKILSSRTDPMSGKPSLRLRGYQQLYRRNHRTAPMMARKRITRKIRPDLLFAASQRSQSMIYNVRPFPEIASLLHLPGATTTHQRLGLGRRGSEIAKAFSSGSTPSPLESRLASDGEKFKQERKWRRFGEISKFQDPFKGLLKNPATKNLWVFLVRCERLRRIGFSTDPAGRGLLEAGFVAPQSWGKPHSLVAPFHSPK